MKPHYYLLLILLICSSVSYSQIQNRTGELSQLARGQFEADTAWTYGAGIGIDFNQLLQINPRVGAGEDRIAFGGLITAFARYNEGRLNWDNSGSMIMGVQRLGSGLSTIRPDQPTPFQKSIDELRLGSKIGLQVNDTSRFYYSMDVTLLTQITPTYDGNFLSDFSEEGDQGLLSRFFSPATIQIAPGIEYKPFDGMSILVSPASYKGIFVLDDDIAAIPALNSAGEPLGKGIHGTPWRAPDDYDNILHQFGATIKGSYAQKYFDDRMTFKTSLTLFSNYLEDPQNIDVEWLTETAFNVWRGINLSLTTNLFYSHNVFVQITDYNEPGGVRGLGRRVSFTQQLYVKYNYVF